MRHDSSHDVNDPSHDEEDSSHDVADASHDVHNPSNDVEDSLHDVHDPSNEVYWTRETLKTRRIQGISKQARRFNCKTDSCGR